MLTQLITVPNIALVALGFINDIFYQNTVLLNAAAVVDSECTNIKADVKCCTGLSVATVRQTVRHG